MDINDIPAGEHLPDDFNTIIEVPAHSDPVRYEMDRRFGVLRVGRFLSVAMHYPFNYGLIPGTRTLDDDLMEVMVYSPFAILPGTLIRCRPLGAVHMTDESGARDKIIAVPIDEISPMTAPFHSLKDMPVWQLNQIQHFCEQYKALEHGKWVKFSGWGSLDEARQMIQQGAERGAVAPVA